MNKPAAPGLSGWKHILFSFSFPDPFFAVKSSAKSSINWRAENVPENQSHHIFFSFQPWDQATIWLPRTFGVWKKSWAHVNVNVVWIKAFFSFLFFFWIVVANKQYIFINADEMVGLSWHALQRADGQACVGEWMHSHEGLCISNRDYKPYSMDQFLFCFVLFLTKTVLPAVYL